MTDETSVELSTDSFTISSLYAHDVKEWRLPEPGSWRVRLSRSGADRSRDPESTADGGDREQWLLEWWRSG